MTAHVYNRTQKWSQAKVHILVTDDDDNRTPRTLCGVDTTGKPYLLVPDAFTITRKKICGNCRRTHVAHLNDTVMPEETPGAAKRGLEIAQQYDAVQEIPARIFRVKGSTDSYTVVIPMDKDLASTCTCMAAKTHPELMCKHQVAAFLVAGGEIE